MATHYEEVTLTPEQAANEVVARWLRDVKMSLYSARAGFNALQVSHPAKSDALVAIELSLELLDAIPNAPAVTTRAAYVSLDWKAPLESDDDDS